jgi:hypothetical protein
MTEDLIARLRDHVNHRGGPSIEGGAWSMMLSAADALEAQARRIEDIAEQYNSVRLTPVPEKILKEATNEIAQLRARIAELEAALKPFADKADKAEGPFEPPYPMDYPLWRAARAALEKK